MTEFDWRRVFSRLRFAHPEPSLREIAAYLHRVSQDDNVRIDPNVLALLAEMIDPDEPKPVAHAKLEIRRLRRKAPPREPDYELRRFLEDQIDVRGEPVEAVVADARDRFGASRAQCFRHLAIVRKYRESVLEFENTLAKMRATRERRSQ